MVEVNGAYKQGRYKKKKLVEKFACNTQYSSFCHARWPAWRIPLIYIHMILIWIKKKTDRQTDRESVGEIETAEQKEQQQYSKFQYKQ